MNLWKMSGKKLTFLRNNVIVNLKVRKHARRKIDRKLLVCGVFQG